MRAKLTQEEYIQRANTVHNNYYDYSKVVYKGKDNKVIIICPIHGEFLQTAATHIYQKSGCPKCCVIKNGERRVLDHDDVIRRFIEIHGNFYDYSKVEYKGTKEHVIIICPTHGEFLQTPGNHLNNRGCPKCKAQKVSNRYKKIFTTEMFIKKARKIHGNIYDYSKTVYTGIENKVIIICKIHGEFLQTPASHLNQQSGCVKCGIISRAEKSKLSTKELLKEFRKIHGDRYDYSKVVYKGIHKKVIIICPDHGEFLQTPAIHKNGCGCPKCNNMVEICNSTTVCASLIEAFYYLKFKEEGIEFDHNGRYPISSEGKDIGTCRFDFYIPSRNEYVEVTSFHNKSSGFDAYSKKIEKKRRFIEDELNSTFTYINRNLSYEEKVILKGKIDIVTRKEIFIKKAKEVHGNLYDYSKVEYFDQKTPVIIICPIHGEFLKNPDGHINQNQGCSKCSRENMNNDKKWTTEMFIEKAQKVHGNVYDYSKVDYIRCLTKVIIICPIHGEFSQQPSSHIFQKSGCPKCRGRK